MVGFGGDNDMIDSAQGSTVVASEFDSLLDEKSSRAVGSAGLGGFWAGVARAREGSKFTKAVE